ncbi:hypothetical protein GCM10022221_53020 [Actinocorallia aurea]
MFSDVRKAGRAAAAPLVKAACLTAYTAGGIVAFLVLVSAVSVKVAREGPGQHTV